MKILFVASIDQHILRFHLPTIKWLTEMGYEVHIACSGNDSIPYCKFIHNIDFVRLPFAIRNIVSFLQLRRVLKKHRFTIVHCNTAVASIITRIACIDFRKKYGLRVFYTVHGFHFFKGSPLYYWLVYYTAEKICSRWLDCLITINQEDFELAKKRFNAKDVQLIPGMGVDTNRFKKLLPTDKIIQRRQYGFPENSKILIYTAEFTLIKNHKDLVLAVSKLKSHIPDLIVILLGRGRYQQEVKDLVNELHLNDTFYFLGFRHDVNTLMGISDVAVSTSMREGLGLNIVESMMSGLPVVLTNNRGHREIVKDKFNGYFFETGDVDKLRELLILLFTDQKAYDRISENAINSVSKFYLQNSLGHIKAIYQKYFAMI